MFFLTLYQKKKEMSYQPFIIKEAEEVMYELRGYFKPSEKIKEELCRIINEKFIAGTFSESDKVIFDSNEELFSFLHFCQMSEDIEVLTDLGLIGSFTDGDSHFVTEKGKKYLDGRSKHQESEDLEV